MSTVEQAIERLYTAFADAPKPTGIGGCTHCLYEEEVDKLLTSRLREIAPDDLDSYASSVFLTVGGVEDFLYFLPRILEVSASEDSWWPSPEVIGRAIGSAKPDSWPAPRREAVECLLEAVIDRAVQTGKHRKIDKWLCAIARIGFDVRPYLEQVARSPEAVLAYFDENASALKEKRIERRLSNAFWELPSPGHDAIVKWFYSDDIWLLLYEKRDFM
jgi:hypothetical protein